MAHRPRRPVERRVHSQINLDLMKKLLFILISFTVLSGASAQNSGSLLNLERIFSSSEFNQERFGPARWIENGDAYTTLELAPGDGRALEIIRYETATGARSVLIPDVYGVPTPKEIIGYSTWKTGSLSNLGLIWRKPH